MTLQLNATLLLGRENMSVAPLGLESIPEGLFMLVWERTRLFLPYFVKVSHFQPLDNKGWEQIYKSNTFDLQCLSFKVS